MEADFSGYATKANLKCSDGRTIAPDAFKHQDQMKVPLVWQHARNEPSNVLGHVLLENREDGVYCHGFFNDTDSGKGAKKLVQHEDVNALSIYANQLIEKTKNVVHGMIREVSLVLAGANPGALIDFVAINHGEGDVEILDDEAVIRMGIPLEHGVSEDPEPEADAEAEEVIVEHAAPEATIKDVFDTLNDEQKSVVYFMLGEAVKGKAEHSDENEADESLAHSAEDIKATMESLNEDQAKVVYFMVGEALAHSEEAPEGDSEGENTAAHADTEIETDTANADNKEGTSMTHNAFEQAEAGKVNTGTALTHAQQADIFKQAKSLGSLRDAVAQYADKTLEHGIDDIDILFPDAKAITTTPDFIKRRTEWVAEVMGSTRHTPFSRIKSLSADLTFEEARAKGYIKGNLKKEEFFRVAKRVTTPQTIYKKQKLDRDDILDITDFDVVAWLKGEMRLMLEEEIARAVLVGDGRSGGDEDKISEDHVRSIANDNDLYVTTINVNLDDANSSHGEMIDALILGRQYYRGSGNPVLFTGETVLARLLLLKDTLGRRLYDNVSDVAAAMRVSKIVTVEIMDDPASQVVAIVVNLQDYTIGADRGGDVAMFDDFDIDYNQYKYLIETRISGALTKPKSALVVRKVAGAAALVDPVAPAWDAEDHTVTVATTTGITYKNKATGATLVTGTPITLTEGQEYVVQAVPASSSYYLSNNAADEFRFTYEDGRQDQPY